MKGEGRTEQLLRRENGLWHGRCDGSTTMPAHTHTHTHRIIILQLFFADQPKPSSSSSSRLPIMDRFETLSMLAILSISSSLESKHTHTHTNRVSSDGECGHLAHTILLYTCLAIKRRGTYTHSSVHKPIPVRDTCDNECALTQCSTQHQCRCTVYNTHKFSHHKWYFLLQ